MELVRDRLERIVLSRNRLRIVHYERGYEEKKMQKENMYCYRKRKKMYCVKKIYIMKAIWKNIYEPESLKRKKKEKHTHIRLKIYMKGDTKQIKLRKNTSR